VDEDNVAWELRDHAWFVGFAPAEAPEIVVAALVEHGGHGGSAAAPVVQKVLARYFEKRAVQNVPAQVAWIGASFVQRAQVSRSEPQPSEDHRVGERRP